MSLVFLKRLVVSFLLAIASISNSVCLLQKPVLTVLIMVKNEAKVIVPTLETYLSKTIKAVLPDDEQVAYVIYDTGSTDGTEYIAQEFLEKKGIKNMLIKKEEFVNYSTSRNRGLAIAEEAFPQSTFILFVDAEWYLNDFDGLLNYCYQHAHDPLQCTCYNILIKDGRSCSFYTARLLRREAGVRFIRRVHEVPEATPCANIPTEIYFKYEPKQEGWENSQKRWARDIDWLLEDYKEFPTDRRLVYLIGQTYANLQDWGNALLFFQKVTEFDAKDEFTYLAYYNMGGLTELVNRLAGKTSKEDWYKAFDYYLKAYSLRPHRAEPLMKIAQHYADAGEMPVSYLFNKRACKLPYPACDVLFVEDGLYDFDRYRLLGINAWYVGDYKNGEKAIKKALEIKPGDSALEHDLACYESRKKSVG